VSVVLLISCPDRPGIVAATADFIVALGGNISHAEQHVDHGSADRGPLFFQRIEFDVSGRHIPPGDVAGAIEPIAREFEMTVDVRRTETAVPTAILASRQPHCLYDLLSRWRSGDLSIDLRVVVSNHPDHADICGHLGVPFRHLPVGDDAVGTIASGAYQRALDDTGADVDLTCAAAPGFVEFVERGETDSDQVRVLAERLLAPVRGAAVDTLLLGCTHYPYLARTISDVMGRDVVLVSSADETAFEMRATLLDRGEVATSDAAPGTRAFYSSGDVEWFREQGRRLFGADLEHVDAIAWD
jgi:hypothetical protein